MVDMVPYYFNAKMTKRAHRSGLRRHLHGDAQGEGPLRRGRLPRDRIPVQREGEGGVEPRGLTLFKGSGMRSIDSRPGPCFNI